LNIVLWVLFLFFFEMKQLKVYLFLYILVASSCNRNNTIIVNESECIVDSFDVPVKGSRFRTWTNNIDNSVFGQSGSQVWQFEKSNAVKFLDSNNLDQNDIFKISNKYFLDNRGNDINLINANGMVLQQNVKTLKRFRHNGKLYLCQFSSSNSFLPLGENQFIVMLLYADEKEQSSFKDYLQNSDSNKLGLFAVEDDTIRFIKPIDFMPHKSFFKNNKTVNYFSHSLSKSKDEIYILYDFHNEIFRLSSNFKILNPIPLPKQLNFKFYNNTSDSINTFAKVMRSQIVGSKNFKVSYNSHRNILYVITMNGMDPEKEYKIDEGLEDFYWNASVFNLNDNQWSRIIHFTPKQDIRNIQFLDEYFIVKSSKKNDAKFYKYKF